MHILAILLHCNVQCYPNTIPMEHFHKIKYTFFYFRKKNYESLINNNWHFNPLISRDLSPRKRLLLFFINLIHKLFSHKNTNPKTLQKLDDWDLNWFLHKKCQRWDYERIYISAKDQRSFMPSSWNGIWRITHHLSH